MTTSGKPTGEWLLSFARENAFALIVAVFAAYSWFQSSNATMIGKVERLESQVAENRVTLKERGRFVREATYQINFLCTRTTDCRALYSPIAVPE